MGFLSNVYHPFERVSIFSQDFKDILNEMSEQVHLFKELHESIAAKLLEVEGVQRVAGSASNPVMGMITFVDDPGGFNTIYTVQNLAGTITTPDFGQPGCTHVIDPVRCDGIPAVTPYNRFFDGGDPVTPDPVLVDFHPAHVDDLVMIGLVAPEEPAGKPTCEPPTPPGVGACVAQNGTCVCCVTQAFCEADPTNTYLGDESCCDPIPGLPEPAVYAIWIVEDVKISTCPGGSPALTGNLPRVTILPPPQLVGETHELPEPFHIDPFHLPRPS